MPPPLTSLHYGGSFVGQWFQTASLKKGGLFGKALGGVMGAVQSKVRKRPLSPYQPLPLENSISPQLLADDFNALTGRCDVM
eukprot:1184323-Prorocentrum_minimum.AAC.1